MILYVTNVEVRTSARQRRIMCLGGLFSSSAFTGEMSAQTLKSSQGHASSSRILVGKAADVTKQAGIHDWWQQTCFCVLSCWAFDANCSSFFLVR